MAHQLSTLTSLVCPRLFGAASVGAYASLALLTGCGGGGPEDPSPRLVQDARVAFDATVSRPTSSTLTQRGEFADASHPAGHLASMSGDPLVGAGTFASLPVAVRVRVVDGHNLPLAGVTAELAGAGVSVTGDAGGNLVLNLTSAVPVLVRLSKDGYANAFVPINPLAEPANAVSIEALLLARPERHPRPALRHQSTPRTTHSRRNA